MKLPDPFDLVFKNKERIFDKYRWELLEWILDFGDGFVKKLQEKKNSQFSAIILTLKYLIQVLLNFNLIRHNYNNISLIIIKKMLIKLSCPK